ncbi:MAG: hydrogenase maturation protease [Acetobacteraceae bacterium]|nr:hydrogenase maturation protease [Acetobacteraceae bacterium]
MTARSPDPPPPRVLVLGYGNPGRQDDGLGPALVAEMERLGWPNLTALDTYQLNIEDAMDVAAHDIVWFVDAAKTGDAPFAVHEVWPAPRIEFTSHLARPEAILAIARQYYGASPKAFLLAIRGYAFEFIEALTPQAADNLQDAVAMLTDRIGSLHAKVLS